MRRWVLSLLLVGCDGTFGLTRIKQPPDAPSTIDGSIGDGLVDATGVDAVLDMLPMNCTTDIFTTLSSADWTVYTFGDGAVGAQSGELLIKTPTNAIAGTGVEGSTRDFRGRSIAITIRQYVATNADNYLSLAAGANSYYRMFANASMLTMYVVTNGSPQAATSMAYSIGEHRHWRIVHQPTVGVSFYTNNDTQDGWVKQHTVPELVSVQNANADIGVFLFQSSTIAREARFDDFTICSP